MKLPSISPLGRLLFHASSASGFGRVPSRDKEARFAPVSFLFSLSLSLSLSLSPTLRRRRTTHLGYGDVRQGGGMIATIHLVVRRRRRCPRRRATPASWRLDSAVRRGTHALLDTDGRDSPFTRRLSLERDFPPAVSLANFSRVILTRILFPFFHCFYSIETVSSTLFDSSIC